MVQPDRVVLSPNFYPGWPRGRPKALVLHGTRSGQRHFTDDQERDATISWFSRSHSQVSAHLLITGSGEKIRIVLDENRAWHAGEHNDGAFGIELTQPTADRPYTDQHYEALAEVCRAYYVEIPPMHILGFRNGSQGYTGHEDTMQGMRAGKSDPGPMFDWDRFIRMLWEEDDMAAMEEIRKLRKELMKIQDFQNELIAGNYAAIGYLSKIAVNHEKRLQEQER